MNAVDHANLVIYLANFAAWLDPRSSNHVDMGYYRQLAQHYLDGQGGQAILDVPPERLAWCDLCGQSFTKPDWHKPEEITGNNYCWCPACNEQQSRVCFMLGRTAYLEAWKDAAEG